MLPGALHKKDLQKKMVFLGGPRQCGKTTLARELLAEQRGRYFNWDSDEERDDILKKRWSHADQMLVFDELHKFPRWKNWIKGIYDTSLRTRQIFLIGSARRGVSVLWAKR